VNKMLDGIRDRLLKERDAQESSVSSATDALKEEKASKKALLKKVSAVDTKIAQKNAVLSQEVEELSATSSRIDQELSLIAKIRVMVDHLNGKKVGKLSSHPAQSCSQLHALGVRDDGVYWLRPDAWNVKKASQFVCRFTHEGGYTLVWNNLFKQSESKKADHKLNWNEAINSIGLVAGGHLSEKINTFTTFTGLARWKALAPAGKLRYEWVRSKSSTTGSHITECDYKFDGPKYIRRLYNCAAVKGSPIWDYGHNNNRKFSTQDQDNDDYSGHCARSYQGPYWYGKCWAGNIHGYANRGAYYRSSSSSWEGNGWYWVR